MHRVLRRRIRREIYIVVCQKFHQIILNELAANDISNAEEVVGFAKSTSKDTSKTSCANL